MGTAARNHHHHLSFRWHRFQSFSALGIFFPPSTVFLPTLSSRKTYILVDIGDLPQVLSLPLAKRPPPPRPPFLRPLQTCCLPSEARSRGRRRRRQRGRRKGSRRRGRREKMKGHLRLFPDIAVDSVALTLLQRCCFRRLPCSLRPRFHALLVPSGASLVPPRGKPRVVPGGGGPQCPFDRPSPARPLPSFENVGRIVVSCQLYKKTYRCIPGSVS